MMILLRIWLRRSLVVWTAPVYLGVMLFAQYSSDSWQYEWIWGMRAPMRTVALLTPILAGATAFDVAGRWQPVMSAMGGSLRRGRSGLLVILWAHVLAAAACVALVSASAAIRLSLNSAIGRPDPWLPLELLATLAAAAAIGLATGTLASPVVAAPVAALLVLGVGTVGGPFGLMNTFAPLGASSSLLGLERDPGAAGFAVALDGAIIALALVVALRRSSSRLLWRVESVAAAAVLIGLVAVPGAALPHEYRPVGERQTCAADGDVKVCGPAAALPHLRDLASGLREATATLESSTLPLPQAFLLATPGQPPDPSEHRTLVWATSDRVRGPGRRQALAEALSVPRDCPQLTYPGPETTALLDSADRVRSWMTGALATRVAQSAPEQVRKDYQLLRSCGSGSSATYPSGAPTP